MVTGKSIMINAHGRDASALFLKKDFFTVLGAPTNEVAFARLRRNLRRKVES